MTKAPIDLRSLARSHTEMALRSLAGVAQHGESEGARVQAAIYLLDRGWGRPATTHTGPDGEGAISVVVRHIIEGGPAPRTIEAMPIVTLPIDSDDDDQ